MGRTALPPEAPGEGPSSLFQLLGAPGVPGLVATLLQSVPLTSYGLLCVSVPLITGPSVAGFQAHSKPG